ncbi:hypothetical protein MRX96_003095 [Rhipicephalus microplus]
MKKTRKRSRQGSILSKKNPMVLNTSLYPLRPNCGEGIICYFTLNIAVYVEKRKTERETKLTGLKPAREEPNGFQDHRLNHSATTAAMASTPLSLLT